MGFMKRIRLASPRSSARRRSRRLESPPIQETPTHIAVECEDGPFVSCSCISLATGSFNTRGVSQLSASSGRLSPGSLGTESTGSFSLDQGDYDDGIRHDLPEPVSRLPSRVFIRTADLPHMEAAADESRRSSFPNLAEDDLVDHVHRPSPTPPLPDMDRDPDERWAALDDGRGGASPLAEAAVAALVRSALDACFDRGMWTENGQTPKLLRSGAWDDTAWRPPEGGTGPVPAPHARGSRGEADVLVWSGRWSHRHYGHDIPAIRCEAVVNMSPRSMMELLVDSARVREYNKMSIGRDDILVLREDENCVTKVSVARTKPPMIGKTLVLKNLLHMEELPGGGEGSGYAIVTRAIAHADDVDAVEDPKVVRSEMMMGLNVIRAVDGDPDRCVLINLNHLRSPMIPQMFAKKLGLSAAVNFINDIRALC